MEHRHAFSKLFKGWQACRYFGRNLGSLASFHGRGFFPSLSGETNLHNPLVVLAAIEAVVGLFIEISFIATFTQRFFGK